MHFSAAASGQLRLHRTTVDSPCCCLVGCGCGARERGERLARAVCGAHAWTVGEWGCRPLQQAAANLISNAINTWRPAEVFVRLSRMEGDREPRRRIPPRRHIPEQPPPGWACLVVEDTGMGSLQSFCPGCSVYSREERMPPASSPAWGLVWRWCGRLSRCTEGGCG